MFGSFLTSGLFWVETLERAVKTFAQTAAALLVGDGTGVITVNWTAVGSVAGLAALASVLTSLASGGITESDTPSLVD